MIKKALLLTFIIGTLTTYILFLQVKSIPTITYFPIDKQIRFQLATTELSIDSQNKNQVNWTVYSMSDEPLYLRQDVSLLYDNGLFKGILSKWVQNTDTVQLKKTFIRAEDYSYLQAISYHYGEIHLDNEQIKATQTMSSDDFYSLETDMASLKNYEKKVNELLNTYWKHITHDLNIKDEIYIFLPLTQLNQFNETNLPELTRDQTDKVIGQLWEGLYKNYIIPVSSDKANQTPHMVPLVLFDKKNTHLIVLYELNGKIEQLYQKYAF